MKPKDYNYKQSELARVILAMKHNRITNATLQIAANIDNGNGIYQVKTKCLNASVKQLEEILPIFTEAPDTFVTYERRQYKVLAVDALTGEGLDLDELILHYEGSGNLHKLHSDTLGVTFLIDLDEPFTKGNKLDEN